MRLACPKCSSDNVQALHLVYESGVSHMHGESSTSGIGLDAGGLGVGVASSRSTGVQKSALAERHAPPEKKSFNEEAVAVVLLLVIVVVAIASSAWVWALVGLGSGVVFVLLIRRDMRFNREEYPLLLEQWRRSFLCFRCGSTFAVK